VRPAAALIGLTGLLLTAAPTAPAWAHSYSYTVETRGRVTSDVGTFAAVARSTLADAWGWSLRGAVSYRQVASRGQFRLVLATPAAVAGASPGCSATWSCRVGDLVLVNEQRWNTGTASWGAGLRAYRQYVINHEVGHWLGLGHRSCPGPGSAAPVMQQQSVQLDGCSSNPWPLPSEAHAVAREQAISSSHLRGAGGADDGQGTTGRATVGRGTAGTVQAGDRGPAVGEWQRQLNQVRDRDIAVDQVFGPETLQATRDFQRRRDILVDGVVGLQTRRAMRSALS
jgi:hypothetical protein